MLTFSARLSVEGGRVRRGRLSLSSGTVRWRSWLRRTTDLTGAAVQKAVMQRVRHRRGAVEVQLRLADGRPARLLLPEAEAAATVRLLSGRDVAGLDPARIRPSGPNWLAVVCLTLAALWIGLWTSIGLDGYTATATVVRSDGGWLCDVTWEDLGGGVQRDESDCFGEPVGSSIEILVPYGDFRGLVTTRPTAVLVGLGGAAPLLLIAALRFRAVSRRRRTNIDLLRLAAGADAAVMADRTASLDRTAAALRQARRRAWAVTAVGMVAVFATGALGMAMDDADADLRATGITTVGTVIQVYPDRRYSTGGLDVRFAVRGESATRYLSVGSAESDYVYGQQVVVLYDRLAPDRFTVDDVSYEPPWTFWPMMAAIFGVLLAAPTGIWMLLRSRRTRRVLEEGSWEPVRVRVWNDDRSSAFITDGGTSWHSWGDTGWGGPRIDLRRLRDWWLSRPESTAGVATQDLGPAANIDSLLEEEPGEESSLEDAWWVREGEHAVFSPDKGTPLVLARLR